ncbi:MAG TPA: c-type cytochrome domain-containing protein [Planctomycetota bacterium]|nr:c-type cytochrome domain-containing protein [Planctomycetota bacterium]
MSEAAEPRSETPRGTGAGRSALGLGTLLLLLGASYVLTRGDIPGRLSLLLGRFHPVVVHLPIGFLVALVGIELLALRKRSPDMGAARGVLLWGACVTSVLSVALGFCLEREGGRDGELLDRHRWLGVATAALCLGAAALRLAPGRRGRVAYGAALAACAILLVWTGHDGGSLTHGAGYLTEHLAGMPPEKGQEAAPPDFAQDVVPIFRAKCVPCHGPGKQDGKFRMDPPALLMEGGESQRPGIVPGDVAASHVADLISRPRDRKGAMPPRGSPALTREEMSTILYWIGTGATGLRKEEGP